MSSAPITRRFDQISRSLLVFQFDMMRHLKVLRRDWVFVSQRREGDADCTKVSINLKGMGVAIVLYFIFGKFDHLRSPSNQIRCNQINFDSYVGSIDLFIKQSHEFIIGWITICLNERFIRYRTPVVKGMEPDWRENLVSRMEGKKSFPVSFSVLWRCLTFLL